MRSVWGRCSSRKSVVTCNWAILCWFCVELVTEWKQAQTCLPIQSTNVQAGILCVNPRFLPTAVGRNLGLTQKIPPAMNLWELPSYSVQTAGGDDSWRVSGVMRFKPPLKPVYRIPSNSRLCSNSSTPSPHCLNHGSQIWLVGDKIDNWWCLTHDKDEKYFCFPPKIYIFYWTQLGDCSFGFVSTCCIP